MRTLKFRAWDKKKTKYYDVRGIQYTDGKLDGVYVNDGSIAGIPNVVALDVKDVVIEQDTGLKDKNGKGICEGDILGGIWEGGYIAWCDKCKQLQFHILTGECMACLGDVHWYELVEDDGELEVIGNIHENEELLK